MKWSKYKEKIKNESKESQELIEEAEQLYKIIVPLIEARKKQGISQKELADLCHVPHSTITKIESFSASPKLETILKMANNLGIEIQLISPAE